MKKVFALWAAALGLVLAVVSHAPLRANLVQAPTAAGTLSCTQATNWLARATGMDTAHQNAFSNMICHLAVTDGIITGDMSGSALSGPTACGSLIGLWYVYATDTSAHALLNLCGNVDPGVNLGSTTFTANSGFTTGSAGMAITAGGYRLDVGGANYNLNSAFFANWSLTSGVLTSATMGVNDGGSYAQMYNRFTGDVAACSINDAATDEPTGVTDGSGFFLCNRSAASGAGAKVVYRNGVSIGSFTSASTTLPDATRDIYMNGQNMNGTLNNGGRLIAMSMLGGSLTGAQVLAIYNRVCNDYLHVINPGAVPSC